jgi:hypothetical protein
MTVVAGLVAGVLSACTNNAVPTVVNERCQLSGSVIQVNFSMFHSIFYIGNGAAVYVSSSTSAVFLQSCSFFNCTAGAETATYGGGGCAYLYNVLSGSGVADCCAASCGAYYGSFWFLNSNGDAVVKGLAGRGLRLQKRGGRPRRLLRSCARFRMQLYEPDRCLGDLHRVRGGDFPDQPGVVDER